MKMLENKKMKSMMRSVFFVILGNFLYALTIVWFVIPSDVVMGGTTGMALAFNYLWNIPISAVVLIFNVLMLLLGWAVLGKNFAVTTLISTFFYPISLDICERIFEGVVLTNDLLLCSVFAGFGIGISLGLVIRTGSSTGGMDIPPLVLHKVFRVPVSVGMYGFDFVILLAQAMFRPAENILYGILLVLIYSIILDKMLLIGRSKTEVKIVSSKSREISDAILRQVDRGVTLFHGEGGYLHRETEIILSVISNRELIQVEKIVHDIDPECFMVVNRVSEVSGRGFSMNKRYR